MVAKLSGCLLLPVVVLFLNCHQVTNQKDKSPIALNIRSEQQFVSFPKLNFEVTVVLRNIARSDVYVRNLKLKYTIGNVIRFMIRDVNNQMLLHRQVIDSDFLSKDAFMKLRVGEEISETVMLNLRDFVHVEQRDDKSVNFEKGEYTLTASYESFEIPMDAGFRPFIGTLTSNEVLLNVR